MGCSRSNSPGHSSCPEHQSFVDFMMLIKTALNVLPWDHMVHVFLPYGKDASRKANILSPLATVYTTPSAVPGTGQALSKYFLNDRINEME